MLNLAIKSVEKIINYSLSLNNKKLVNSKILIVYDLDSFLSKNIFEAFDSVLNKDSRYNSIDFNLINIENLKNKLLSLEKNDTVILIQSTNFRIENFRIRILLQQNGIACLEFNHLIYIKDEEHETYLKSIGYDYESISKLSTNLKNILDNSKILEIDSLGLKFIVNGGFEDTKTNSGIYDLSKRYATFPPGENFTEAKHFSKVNGEIFIKAFPGLDFQVRFLQKPFKITIKNSIITHFDNNTPKEFIEIYDMIKKSENDVMIRELGFGLNNKIDFINTLSDVNSFERMAGFHFSIGKKHNIYRKKLTKDIIQRYHIDIFPVVDFIKINGEKVYFNGKYNI